MVYYFCTIERRNIMFGIKKKDKQKESPRSAQKHVEIQATLLKKSDEPIEEILSGDFMPEEKPIFELTFACEDGSEVVATVSEFEFGAVTVGDQGLLVYDAYKYCNEIISFADKIKAFSMEED